MSEHQTVQGISKDVEVAGGASSKDTKNDTILKQHPRRTNPAASGIYVPRRMPHREMSSSIASNLASARGIRSKHDRRALSPSVTTRQVPGSLESPSRRHGDGIPAPIAKSGWVPPVTEPSKAAAQVSVSEVERSSIPAPSAVEEGFQRWSSTFGSLLSKISAPLAFAGLPLTAEEASPEKGAPTKQKRPAHSTSVRDYGDPDLTKIFSKSALSTLRHQNHGGDSFYVVPTAGGTVSYSSILSYADKEKRRLAASHHSAGRNSLEDDNDAFVDARESFGPQSPVLSRTSGNRRARSAKEMEVIVEELSTQNKSLKECIDQLTRRLHSFEMAAQSSGMAMQESIRFQRSMSPAAARVADSEAPNAKQLAQMMEQMDGAQKEIMRLGRDNERLKNVVERYRGRWEKLKEGAKTRRADSGSGQATPKGGGAQSDAANTGRFMAG